VIVDLAAETGGNCELSEPGETVLRHDVKIIAPLNVPSTMAEHASQLYARNIQSLLGLMIDEGELKLDFDDEVIAGACITRGGDGGGLTTGGRGDRERRREGGRRSLKRDRKSSNPIRTRGRRPRGGVFFVSTITEIAILVLAAFVGFEVISKVPNTLHTPLMS